MAFFQISSTYRILEEYLHLQSLKIVKRRNTLNSDVRLVLMLQWNRKTTYMDPDSYEKLHSFSNLVDLSLDLVILQREREFLY